MTSMRGITLPGNSTVEIHDFPMPKPGHGQVLLRIRASGICGSDLRCAYFERVGVGAEAYLGVIAGHEPAGEVVAVGPGCDRLANGDRVLVYHISGCGQCPECRRGYMVGCTSESRTAYGWQRDGGHAEFMLAEERTCIQLPETLSFVDGALVACGFGTVYEALCRAHVSGRDSVLITGLGPIGLAAGLLAQAMGAKTVLGVDVSPSRVDNAMQIGAITRGIHGDRPKRDIVSATAGHGAEVAVDCSGSRAGRLVALQGTRKWGRCVFVGEGNTVDFDVSHDLIHRQITLIGSWVTSIFRMEELVEKLARWQLSPEMTVSRQFPLEEASNAYAVAAEAQAGKVVIATP